MKRWFIVAGLMMLFFVALFGLAGCGLLSQASDTDLTNAVGSGNGPGSGNWKPARPENLRQARQLHGILVTLSEKGSEISTSYDRLYDECFDLKGNLLPDKEAKGCIDESLELANSLRSHFHDFYSGAVVYATWADENKDEDPPKTPDPPRDPKNDPPPDTEDPGDDDDDGWGCCWCLTCIYGIAPEYVFHPVELEVVFTE